MNKPTHVLTLLCVVAASAFGSPMQAEAQELKIGFLAPRTGIFTQLGTDMVNGFQMYLDEHNGMLGGAKVTFIVEDDQGKADVDVAKAKKLILQDKVDMLVGAVEARLLTPVGLRTLAPDDPAYVPHCQGSPRERDGAYHQGTVWPWLLGPFVEAWVRVRGNTPEAKRAAWVRFLAPLLRHLDEAGLGHISEIADADPPHAPRGCPFQAWSLGEALRLDLEVLAD